MQRLSKIRFGTSIAANGEIVFTGNGPIYFGLDVIHSLGATLNQTRVDIASQDGKFYVGVVNSGGLKLKKNASINSSTLTKLVTNDQPATFYLGNALHTEEGTWFELNTVEANATRLEVTEQEAPVEFVTSGQENGFY